MTKQEFIKKVHVLNTAASRKEGVYISDEEYAIIETVYAWHPSISNEFGKDEIVYLYCSYGWALIMDMLPRAKRLKGLERDITRITQDYESEMQRLESVKERIIQGID